MSPPRRHPALDAWGEYDRDDPFPLFAQVRVAGPVHEAGWPTGTRRGWSWATKKPGRRWPTRGSRRTCTRRRRAARRSSRTAFPGLRWPPHAGLRPTRPHPVAAAGLARLQQAAGRRAGDQGPVGRRPPARRPGRSRRRQPPRRSRGGLRVPPAVHGDQRAARDPGAGSGRSRPVVPHPARPLPRAGATRCGGGRVGAASDHVHRPIGVAGGDQLGQLSGVRDLPGVPRSPQLGQYRQAHRAGQKRQLYDDAGHDPAVVEPDGFGPFAAPS
jgi:hypothetical protein